jgi:WhiB family transcriptional regulator, redox-sensing transcriptional regulator
MTLTTTHREGVTASRFSWVEQWALQGSCTTAEPDALFVRGAAQQLAKQVCMS